MNDIERSPTYRTDSAMRILFGLGVIDLVFMIILYLSLMNLLPFSGIASLALSAGIAWFSGLAFSRLRASFPYHEVRQYLTWLFEPKTFTPRPDRDARPLVGLLVGDSEGGEW